MKLKLLRNNKGQALAETALILPVLLLVVLAALTVGLMIYQKMVVVLASSQAARVGASIYNDPSLTADEKTAKINTTAYFYLGNGLSGTDRSVDIWSDGTIIKVKVTYNFKFIFPLVGEIVGHRTTIPIIYESSYLIQ
ncbi:MAG: TadE/TadG family type IV pilus assembly protein [Bacillota bacterium]